MKRIAAVILCAGLVSGCMANWESHRSGQRWAGVPYMPLPNQNSTPQLSQPTGFNK